MAGPSVAGEARHRRPGSSRRPDRSARRCRGPAHRRPPARRPRGWRPGGRRRPDSARRPTSSSPLPSTNDPRKSMAKARAALPRPRAACVAAMVEPLLPRRLVRRTVANARRGIGRRVAGRSCRPVVTGSGVVFVGYAHRGTADLQAEWDRASLRLLPRLLAAERGEVEVAIAVVELLDAAAVGGVGVEDLLTDPQERADARQFCAAHAL